ncbi:Hypothetical protein PFREUD_23040 [Propionibacterium freudenreichii subsp. shermanii CIRM-BIA1]|uniref:Uncharacterized protein n=1 Tax=Propionibacterium freudenreichii subsp. shermanii (strain ATCC 9614 / DSM 4902 / CIP 103027 / NCIMB 8099 / CIRM-BIA1) TaxID=754252 RepID=D7GH03_PROFC|nr:Hypothetical protein PFREUD_23040 [Propionibacterium freudenreichii subsp. shermanii CIRM-BIA1]
MAAFSRLPVA